MCEKIINRYTIISILLILLQPQTLAQTVHSLRGQIVNELGEPIIGAAVRTLHVKNSGAISDIEGNFELHIKSIKDTVEISCLGFETLLFSPTTIDDEPLRFVLTEEVQRIDEVMVSANSFNSKLTTTQIGSENIVVKQIKKLPALFGEPDIIKTITLYPGVKSAGDGTTGFQVRGGSTAQNLVLLDDAPIYNAGHVMGIFAAFNDEVLGNARLYKGLMPAQFGGATSSVLDVKTQTGEASKFNAGFDIGLLSSNAYVKGALANNKVSYQVAARRSYFDLFLKALDSYKDNTIYFYDVNAKVNYKPTDNDRLTFSLFTSKDNLTMKNQIDLNGANRSASLQWLHRYSKLTTSSTSLVASNFSTENQLNISGLDNSLKGGVKVYGLKHRTDIETEKTLWDIGVQASLIEATSGDFNMGSNHLAERRNGIESALWLNADYKPTEAFSVSGGLRLTSFAVLGGAPFYEFDSQGNITNELNDYGKTDIVNHYLHLEPRLSANWRLSSQQSFKVGYARTTQNVYNIMNASMEIPFTRFTMASNYLKPIVADQVSLGYTHLFANDSYELSTEAYYKNIDNVYEYRDGKNFSSEILLERLLLGGRGRSYGVEMLAKKNIGRLTGWMGYTLSWTQNKIDGINNNKWYTASNDVRHDFSIVGLYDLTDNWSVSLTWIYQTGQALNVPSAKYEVDGNMAYYYAERNGYRAPDYHRMDVSFVHQKKMKRYTRKWSIGVYNLYGKYNPFIISLEDDLTEPSGTKTMLTAMFSILPSVNYGIYF